MSGTGDKRPNKTEDAPAALTAQGIPWGLGAVSQKQGQKPNVYEKYVLVI